MEINKELNDLAENYANKLIKSGVLDVYKKTWMKHVYIEIYKQAKNDESNKILKELLDWNEISLSANSKLGASDEVIKALLSVKYKIESLLIK